MHIPVVFRAPNRGVGDRRLLRHRRGLRVAARCMSAMAALTVLAATADQAHALCFPDEFGGECVVNGEPGISACLAGHPVCIPVNRKPPPTTGTPPPSLCPADTDVLTYHNDPQRTGWNQTERLLSPATVNPNFFGFIKSVDLDDQVDAQPLVVTGQRIVADGHDKGVHTVVYVVTENNTVYAIDACTGEILNYRNLGPPVPKPLDCGNNGPNVGITGTPVINKATRTLYLIAYKNLLVGEVDYILHALDLSTLADNPGSPVRVEATGKLSDGTTFSFNAAFQRQRPALLLANGKIYAGFGSFCDWGGRYSRGWVLGWDLTLNPLGTSALINRDVRNIDCVWLGNQPCFLASIWMSGYGLAADPQGDLFFTTGNTADKMGGSYDTTLNLAESAVKMSGDLTTVLDFFTPGNERELDQGDMEFGSGGLLVLPDNPGLVPSFSPFPSPPFTLTPPTPPQLAAAAGKEGHMFLLDRNRMGGFHSTDVPPFVDIDACWCGPSFFIGPDGFGRVVSSGGSTLRTWTISSTNRLALQSEASSKPGDIATARETERIAGFFTSISSNGRINAIIWAIGRPVSTDDIALRLYAFDAAALNGGKLQSLLPNGIIAGAWPSLQDSNAFLVPTVANGMVYVASGRVDIDKDGNKITKGQLRIFGLTPLGPGFPIGSLPVVTTESSAAVPVISPNYWGILRQVDGDILMIQLRNGNMLEVDISEAVAQQRATPATVGQAVAVSGVFTVPATAQSIFRADTLWRVKGQSTWGEDIPPQPPPQ
jgi:hypothetical protein